MSLSAQGIPTCPCRIAQLDWCIGIGLPNQPAPMVSIFVVPDRGDCGSMCRDMQLRKWYSCNGKADCRRKVLRTTDGSLLYFLVCCDDRDLAALSETIAQSLQLASQPGR